MSQKKPLIAGNWKMYKTIEEACFFVETLAPLIGKSQATLYLAAPFTAIFPLAQRVKELGGGVTVGAQNMHDATEGAFTGEISSQMLRDAGAEFVILGHSERRHFFHESDAFINKKVKRAFLDGIQPILCVGETLEQRESGQTKEVLARQLLGSLDDIEEIGDLVLAYEPVWAIGTGLVACANDAEEAHHFCRELVSKEWGSRAAEKLVIQYGGSVKAENAAQLLEQENVDGLLVGGASLLPESFIDIVRVAI